MRRLGLGLGLTNRRTGPAAPSPPDPDFYWPFEEGAGSTVAELIAGRTMTLHGSPTWVAGRKGAYAVQFNGTTQWGETLAIDCSAVNKMSVAFWVLYPSYGSESIALELTDNFNNYDTGLLIEPTDSSGTTMAQVLHRIPSIYHFVSYPRPSTGVWHHLVGLFDKSTGPATVTLYIDGSLVSGSIVVSDTNPYNFANAVMGIMGRVGGALLTAGSMDDLRVYRRLLTPAEITILAS